MKLLKRIKQFKSILRYAYEDVIYSTSFLNDYNYDEEVIFAKLRQHSHILDKGLHIIPFEKGHSKAVYQLCIGLRNKITNEDIKTDPAYKWANRVINDYERAQRVDDELFQDGTSIKVFSEKDKSEFYKVIKSRTSCRNFFDEIIPDYIWNEIINVAIDAPTGCCRQTTRFYIEKDCKKIHALCSNIAGATGFSGNIPYLICISSDTRPYSIKDRFLPYIDASLSIENFILACTVNNIHGVPLNWQHATRKQNSNVRKILNMPEYEKIILFIAAGKAIKLPIKPKRVDIRWLRKR